MKRRLLILILILSVFTFIACKNNDSASQDTPGQETNDPAANTRATITGSAVKGPIDGAEMKLFYFNDDGTQTEITAENAPVLTASNGAFEFEVNPQDLENINAPLVMKSAGGTMGGQPAPELKTIIPDPGPLKTAGQVISRHLSTASSVAAAMLENRMLETKSPPQGSDAEACIAKVEEALEIDLEQDPADVTQAVAMINLNVDENLDLFNSPQNNSAVEEYIEYLARNFDSSSGMWDDKMTDPQHPGEDMDAGFHEFGDGHLDSVCPNGPARMLNLMVKADKNTILSDGADTATISLKLRNGWGRYAEDEPRIDLVILSGEGQLSDANPPVHHGWARITFTSTTPGEVIIQANCSLDNGNTIAQEIAIEVVDPTENAAPVADAGKDLNVAIGTLVSLDGSQSSDVNNDPLTYSWVLSTPGGSNAILSDPTIFNPSFTADVDGTYVAELVVNDGTQDSAPSSVTITTASGNSAPTADAGPDQNVATGSNVTLDGSGSQDADSDPLTYSWTLVSKPAGSSAVLANNTEVTPSFTADADGTYLIELVVNDGIMDSTPATVSITASMANSAPTANAGPDQTVDVGTAVSIDGTGSGDSDQDPLTYSWTLVSKPSGSAAALPDPADTEMVFFTPDVAGAYVVQLVVNDGSVDSTPDTVTITATAAGPDGAALFSANCAACHGADGTQLVNLRGISASAIENKMPHKNITIDDIGGTAGAQAIADFLAQ